MGKARYLREMSREEVLLWEVWTALLPLSEDVEHLEFKQGL